MPVFYKMITQCDLGHREKFHCICLGSDERLEAGP